jgi:hypothetical protein
MRRAVLEYIPRYLHMTLISFRSRNWRSGRVAAVWILARVSEHLLNGLDCGNLGIADLPGIVVAVRKPLPDRKTLRIAQLLLDIMRTIMIMMLTM